MATKTGQTYVQTSTGMVITITPTSPYVGTVPVNHGGKPEKFLGTAFKRWQKRMLSKGGETKKYKFNGMCYICNKEGHRAKDCRYKRKGKGRSSKKVAKAKMTEMDEISNGVDAINLSAVVFEANLVGNPKEW